VCWTLLCSDVSVVTCVTGWIEIEIEIEKNSLVILNSFITAMLICLLLYVDNSFLIVTVRDFVRIL